MSEAVDPLDNDPAVKQAKIKKFLAEAALAEAMAATAVDDALLKKNRAAFDLRLASASALEAEHKAAERFQRSEEARLEIEEMKKERREKDASNSEHRVYDFVSSVDGGSTEAAMGTLSRWARLSKEPITIRFSSPGGGVIAGFALYDYIVDGLRGQQKIHVTTIGMGYAASMGAVLLQAGDVRMMGSQASLLIHEISSAMIGKLSELEDEVVFSKKLNERIVDIFAARAKTSKAMKPMSRSQIKVHSKRKDFWVSADEALKWGFIDATGYEPAKQ